MCQSLSRISKAMNDAVAAELLGWLGLKHVCSEFKVQIETSGTSSIVAAYK